MLQQKRTISLTNGNFANTNKRNTFRKQKNIDLSRGQIYNPPLGPHSLSCTVSVPAFPNFTLLLIVAIKYLKLQGQA